MWYKERSSRTNDFLLPSPNCFKSFFINRQSRKFAFIDVEVKKVKSIKKKLLTFSASAASEKGKQGISFPSAVYTIT